MGSLLLLYCTTYDPCYHFYQVAKAKRIDATCPTFRHLSKMEMKCHNIGYQMLTQNTCPYEECLSERNKVSWHMSATYVYTVPVTYFSTTVTTSSVRSTTKLDQHNDGIPHMSICHQRLFLRPYKRPPADTTLQPPCLTAVVCPAGGRGTGCICGPRTATSRRREQ